MAEANEIITINFKTTKGSKESVQIAKSATVEELKQKIEEKSSDLSADRQRVIYKGIILKDDKIVADSGLQDGQSVVISIKKAGKAKTAAPNIIPHDVIMAETENANGAETPRNQISGDETRRNQIATQAQQDQEGANISAQGIQMSRRNHMATQAQQDQEGANISAQASRR